MTFRKWPKWCSKTWNLRNECVSFCRVWEIKICIQYYTCISWIFNGQLLCILKMLILLLYTYCMVAIMWIFVQVDDDNAPAYVYRKMKQVFLYYNVKHITITLYIPTWQEVIERSNFTLNTGVIPTSERDCTVIY